MTTTDHTTIAAERDETPPGVAAVAPHVVIAERSEFALDKRLGVLLVGLRWLAAGVGALVALRNVHPASVAAAVALLAFAAWQTVRRPQLDPPDRSLPLLVFAELALDTLAVAITGGLGSPFVVVPAVAIFLAGYTFSERRVMAAAYVAMGSVGVLALLGQASEATSRSATLIGAMYVLCGALGAFTRRIAIDTTQRQADAFDQVSHMLEANELLVALHGVAQTLPASFDLAEVVTSTRARLRSLFDSTALTMFVRDNATGQWRPELAEGLRLPRLLTDDELPSCLLAAFADAGVQLADDLLAGELSGCAPFARSGLYVSLRARGSLMGFLAIEHSSPGQYTNKDAALLDSLAAPLALSLDNALWFGRLHTLGAEAERARIARDLHDRIAQSLAYISFELERLTQHDTAEPSRATLVDLHSVVHGVVTELRDTLYELRAAVSDSEDLVTVADRHLARFAARHNIDVDFLPRVNAPLSVPLQQELGASCKRRSTTWRVTPRPATSTWCTT